MTIPIFSWKRLQAASVLVDAWRALPIEHIYEVPGILIEFDLKLALFVDRKLAGRIQDARALAPVRVVQVELSARKIEGRGLTVRPDLSES